MLKVALTISTILITGFIKFLVNFGVITTWNDLGISRQISIFAGLILMLVVGITAAIVMTSLYIKSGYSGLNGILEDKEVALLMSHIFGFVALEVFIFMVTFKNELDPPSIAYWICSGAFIAPEVYLAIHSIMKKGKINGEG